MDYNEARQFLNSLMDYSLISNAALPVNFDLKRVVDLLELMGNPHEKYPTIHITGTKGKGSIAAIMASVLQCAGYKTGLFSSPFLLDFCEHIQINRQYILKNELAQLVDEIKPFINKINGITAFEAIMSLCFHYFYERKVDIAIIEVGFGGSTDATNVVKPLISVISPISLDHTAILGNSIQAVSASEAGIIKPGCPVVVAPQVYKEAIKIVTETADQKHAEVILAEKELKYSEISHNLDEQEISIDFFREPNDWTGKYVLSLLGQHQIDNAATALTALRQLSKSGFPISKDQVAMGLADVTWPCRFEIVSKHPLIVLDGAHNVDSARKLKQAITHYLNDFKIIFIFGVSQDKDITGILEVLLPGCEEVIFSKSQHPRASIPAMLVKLVENVAIKTRITDDLVQAMDWAKKSADQKTAIVVTGSLFIAAEARQLILNPNRLDN